MSNTFDKLSVLDSFIEEVNSYLPEIEANLGRLAVAPGDLETLEETYRRAHTISGSSSMMDFSGIAHISHGMEDLLGDALEGLTILDAPTIGLLQRSLARVQRLVASIRAGGDQEQLIAEDDADYVQYRTFVDVQAQLPQPGLAPDSQQLQVEPDTSSFQPPAIHTPVLTFDEMFASFHSVNPVDAADLAWSEESPLPPPFEPLPDTDADTHIAAPTSLEAPDPAQSALEMLVATTRQPYSDQQPPPGATPLPDQNDSLLSQVAPLAADASAFLQPYNALHEDVQFLEQSASSLKNVLAQLRAAMSVIEDQRTEFKGFLDGSKDALERMEEWAGLAMGLNLRNSPEQVRRYLPLSVLWVTNTKLNKILDALTHITNDVALTDDQLAVILMQLSTSLTSCGVAFQHLQSAFQASAFTQQPGWSPWEVDIARDAAALRERVTFERQGDPLALRAEIETSLREELRREYEANPATLAARAELEQQIRGEVLREFEEKRRLHERVTGPGAAEELEELASRLRNELEIQVRQEFLNQIQTDESDLNKLVPSTQLAHAPTAQHTSNYLDQVREATSLSEVKTTSVALPPPPAQHATPSLKSDSLATADFGEEATEIFRMEAEEHLQTISMYVAALEKEPTNPEIVQSIRRATHTLKGAAGMMGFRAIAELCHIFEDLLEMAIEASVTITPDVLSIILDTTVTLDELILNKADESSEDDAKVQALRARYEALLGVPSAVLSSLADTIDIDEVATEGTAEGATSISAIGTTTAADGAQRPAKADLSVRVRLQRLDELVNLFGELLVNRTVLEERIERLVRLVADVGISSARLQDVGQKLESRFEAATLPSGHTLQVLPAEGNQTQKAALTANGNNSGAESSHLAEFDELELDRYTEFHQLTRGLSEGISDMSTLGAEMEATIRECESVFARENRLSATFQDRLMKARLVPLSTMAPRLYRTASAVALKQQKQFEFLLEGDETEVDRTVYEEIAGPLLHLVRNAVNHAIETPETRLQKGKPAAGHITLSASYEGNLVVITVRDDGTGIDPQRVRVAAIERGLIQPDQALTDSEVVDLIFRPGFSTSEVLSHESGRGVGLDVVRDSVSRLRGTLEVENTPGQGTAFTMRFPTSLAIQSVIMLRAGGQQFAIPALIVESIGRLDNFKRAPSGKQPAIIVQNETCPLSTLADLLSLPPGQLDEKAPILLINAGGYRVALIVDEIRGRLDVVMKSLGPHLRHVHGVAGGAILGNGRVMLVLEMMELLSTHFKPGSSSRTQSPPSRRQRGIDPTSQIVSPSLVVTALAPQRPSDLQPPMVQAPRVKQGKHVLVVDDSPSVRRVVGNMLKQHGWESQMARDGVEALDMLSRETPLAILLDIEMPRMDGYELIATVRSQEQYRTLPLVVLTSRAATKHQQRAIQLGANAYIVKPYQDEELINILNTLVYGAPAR